MSRRSEHFFGDIIRMAEKPEDEYLNIAIIPAKPRSKHISELDRRIARYELNELLKEFKGAQE